MSEDSTEYTAEELEKLKKAGSIASQAVEYARSIVKKDTPLVEICESIESKIKELGGQPAFPVTLCINEVAAHSTPAPNSTDKAHGLIKVDIGCHIDGYVADTAITLDLENSTQNQELIKAAQSALSSALKITKIGTSLSEIGRTIETSIKSDGFLPIQNLSGHSIDKFDLHSGLTIPNFDNSSPYELEQGLFAIEPFCTLDTGAGLVKDGKPSNIYHLEKPGSVRDPKAREVLAFIAENYSTLPFCSRWIFNEFGSRGLLALRQIEQAGLLHHYKQLVEKNAKPVAQAEHSVLLQKDKTITTKRD